MRTKTLALSTLLGAIGTATSLVAQTNVYSVNAVGYVNLTLPPGYSILTCPLIVSPNNALSNLFPVGINGYVPTGNNASPYFGAGVNVFSGGSYTGAGKSDSISYSGGWNQGGTIQLNPGMALFFNNPSAVVLSNTFVGTVPQNNNYNMTNTMAPGYNMVGSIVPVTGNFASPIINMTNGLGDFDSVNFFNPQTQSYQTVEASYSKGWNGTPQYPSGPVSTNVTQGFFYYNATFQGPAGGYPETSSNELWVENFSVNP